jgi:hypothetical protein
MRMRYFCLETGPPLCVRGKDCHLELLFDLIKPQGYNPVKIYQLACKMFAICDRIL